MFNAWALAWLLFSWWTLDLSLVVWWSLQLVHLTFVLYENLIFLHDYVFYHFDCSLLFVLVASDLWTFCSLFVQNNIYSLHKKTCYNFRTVKVNYLGAPINWCLLVSFAAWLKGHMQSPLVITRVHACMRLEEREVDLMYVGSTESLTV